MRTKITTKRASDTAFNYDDMLRRPAGKKNLRRCRCGRNKFVSVNEDLRVCETFGERERERGEKN